MPHSGGFELVALAVGCAPIAAIPDRYPLSRLAARVQPLGSYCRT